MVWSSLIQNNPSNILSFLSDVRKPRFKNILTMFESCLESGFGFGVASSYWKTKISTSQKALLCIWRYYVEIIHFELLQMGQAIPSPIYCQQTLIAINVCWQTFITCQSKRYCIPCASREAQRSGFRFIATSLVLA